MSVTTAMYPLRPIFELDQQIPLPECMYHMKNLHGQHSNGFSSTEKSYKVLDNIMEQASLPEVEMLENQQEGILKKLALLKEQIEMFRLQLSQPITNASVKHVVSGNTSQVSFQGDVNDLVIYASPNAPPYGLLAVSKMWEGRIAVSSHAHSTLSSKLSSTAIEAFNQIGTSQQQKQQLRITLVWKDVGQQAQLIISPTRHTVLHGEVNVLRLLSHIGPAHTSLGDLNVEEMCAADWILDCVYQLTQGSASKRDLNTILQRIAPSTTGWLLNKSSPSIVDAAMWSYFKSKDALDCTAKLKNWQEKCNIVFLS